MVRFAALLMALALAPTALALTVQTDRRELALGEPLTLSLDGPADALERIDLDPLRRDFEVHARTLSRQNERGSLALTLYPLRTGKLTLPALAAGRERSRPLHVTVHAESDAMPRVTARIETEPAAPYVRQPTRLTLELCDDGSLDWKRPALPTHAALHLRPLGEEQMEVERDGGRCTARRYHWAALPTQAGEIVLPLPMLEAGKFGQRLRLPPPAAAFTAAPAPAWLPLNVPVGRPTITAEPLPPEWPLERPLAWRLTVEGGYSVDGLKAMLALQLQGSPILSAYRPSIEPAAPEEPNTASTRLDVSFYILPRDTGTLVLPEIALPYFDPASGRLEQVRLPGPILRVFDPIWDKIFLAVSAIVGLGGVTLLTWAGRRELRWRTARKAALERIRQASDMAELAHALRAFTLAADTPPASTLGLWRQRMHRQSPGTAVDAPAEAVEAALYGRDDAALETLRQRALSALATAAPGRRMSVGAASAAIPAQGRLRG